MKIIYLILSWIGGVWFALGILVIAIGASPSHPIPDMMNNSGQVDVVGGAFMMFVLSALFVGFPLSFWASTKLPSISTPEKPVVRKDSPKS